MTNNGNPRFGKPTPEDIINTTIEKAENVNSHRSHTLAKRYPLLSTSPGVPTLPHAAETRNTGLGQSRSNRRYPLDLETVASPLERLERDGEEQLRKLQPRPKPRFARWAQPEYRDPVSIRNISQASSTATPEYDLSQSTKQYFTQKKGYEFLRIQSHDPSRLSTLRPVIDKIAFLKPYPSGSNFIRYRVLNWVTSKEMLDRGFLLSSTDPVQVLKLFNLHVVGHDDWDSEIMKPCRELIFSYLDLGEGKGNPDEVSAEQLYCEVVARNESEKYLESSIRGFTHY